MPTDAWSRAEEIIDRFLDEAPVPTAEALKGLRVRLQHETEAVRSEVESLVGHLLAEEPFVEDGLAASAPRLMAELASESPEFSTGARRDLGPGDRLGPWRLIEELGRGGMGIVYLAERADRQFEKQVAVKLVAGSRVGAEARRRFLRERQILAGLDHPSIARLLDGGVADDGAPYLVMELVRGDPIDRWCERTSAGLELRLELFLEVCDAVAAAHEQLIVHRDIKPGNVLVTDDGRVKLLDFGIAGLVEEAGTESAATVVHAFTPEFASPEQVRLERAGTASDVYSLGVLLYLLLARRLPYETRGSRPAEVERLICEVEAPLPSAAVVSGSDARDDRACSRLARRLRGDLDHIVLRALAKETSRRYPSAAELARDVRRHLQGLPVEARPATVGYRTHRFVARNRLAVVASCAIVLSLVVGLAVAASQAARAARERDLARAEAAKAETVSEFLTELFREADPFEGSEPTASDLLERGEAKIATELAEHPEARADLLGAMSRAFLGLGNYVAARRLADEAVELKRRLLPAAAPELAEAILDQSAVAAAVGEDEEAQRLARDALARFAASGEEDRELGVRVHRALAGYELPRSLDAAERHLLRAIRIQRELSPGESSALAQLLHQLGVLRESQGRIEEGLDLKLEALAMQEAQVEPGAPVVHQMQSNLAITMVKVGRLEEAERLYDAAISGLEARLGPSHPSLIAALTSYGSLLLRQGRFGEAVRPVERAVELANALEHDRSDALGARVNLATLRREQGRHEEALRLYRNARARFRALGIGDGTPAAARIDSLVGQTLIRLGRLDEARERLRGALSVQESVPGVHAGLVAETRAAIGEALCRRGDSAEGLELIERACHVMARDLDGQHWQSAACAIELAACELRLGSLDSAASRLELAEPAIRGRLPAGSYWSSRLEGVTVALASERRRGDIARVR